MMTKEFIKKAIGKELPEKLRYVALQLTEILDEKNFKPINQNKFSKILKVNQSHVSQTINLLVTKDIVLKNNNMGVINYYKLNEHYRKKGIKTNSTGLTSKIEQKQEGSPALENDSPYTINLDTKKQLLSILSTSKLITKLVIGSVTEDEITKGFLKFDKEVIYLFFNVTFDENKETSFLETPEFTYFLRALMVNHFYTLNIFSNINYEYPLTCSQGELKKIDSEFLTYSEENVSAIYNKILDFILCSKSITIPIDNKIRSAKYVCELLRIEDLKTFEEIYQDKEVQNFFDDLFAKKEKGRGTVTFGMPEFDIPENKILSAENVHNDNDADDDDADAIAHTSKLEVKPNIPYSSTNITSGKPEFELYQAFEKLNLDFTESQLKLTINFIKSAAIEDIRKLKILVDTKTSSLEDLLEFVEIVKRNAHAIYLPIKTLESTDQGV